MARGISGRALRGENPSQAALSDGLGNPIFAISRRFDTDVEVICAKTPFRFRIIDIAVHCYETNASGDVTIEVDDAGILQTAISCNTIEEVTGSGDLDGAGAPFLVNLSGANGTSAAVVPKGSKLEVVPTNAASGMITLLCVKSEE